MNFITRGIDWANAMIFVVGVWLGVMQEDSRQNLLDCYSPIKTAFSTIEPDGGADENVPPIIFLHGIGSTKESWFDIPQIVGNRTNRKVYVLDARNHGESGYSNCFNFDVTAVDLLHFMDKQGIPKAIMIGCSLGAISIIKVALSQPERVEKAFMEDMYVSRIHTDKLQNLANYIQLLEEAAENVPVEYNDTAAVQYVINYVKDSEIKRAATGDSTRKGSNRGLVTLVKDENGRRRLKVNVKVIYNTLQSTETTMLDNVGTYDGPAYFIYGPESPFRSDQDKENIEEHLPMAKLMPVEGSNHEVHAMFPDDFIEDVLKYLT